MTSRHANASSHYSRYEDDVPLNSDEEEEERRLSELYGEAADDDDDDGIIVGDITNSRKRGRQTQVNNTILTEEDAAAAKEFEEKVRNKAKKVRPSLQPLHLKSAKGLVYVRRSFPTLVKKYKSTKKNLSLESSLAIDASSRAQKLIFQSQINAAARYSHSLMTAYRQFAQELFPSLAVEDVFLKIEDLGSKKEVKDYLQLMRDEFRREYLEGIYGVEKAGRLLNELEHGLKAQQVLSSNPYNDDEEYANAVVNTSARDAHHHGTVVPRLGRAVTSLEDADNEDVHVSILKDATAPANPYVTTSSHVTGVAPVANGDDAMTTHAKEDEKVEANFHDTDQNREVEVQHNYDNEEDGDDNQDSTGTEMLELEGVSNVKEDIAKAADNAKEKMNFVDENFQNEDKTEDELQPPTALTRIIQDRTMIESNSFCNDDTQETLTLLESQFEDDIDESQDEISSKSIGENLPHASHTRAEAETQDEEEMSVNERFSQFTESGIIFEQDEEADYDDDNVVSPDLHANCGELGQPSQLSMEY